MDKRTSTLMNFVEKVKINLFNVFCIHISVSLSKHQSYEKQPGRSKLPFQDEARLMPPFRCRKFGIILARLGWYGIWKMANSLTQMKSR